MSGDKRLEIQIGVKRLGDKCLRIHSAVKCDLASNVTCLLVVKCLWRQLSQPLTGVRGLASNVWATNVLGVKQPESHRPYPPQG